MNTGTQTTDDFERWFYGGTPPEGDRAFESAPPAEVAGDCHWARASDALIERLRASAVAPIV